MSKPIDFSFYKNSKNFVYFSIRPYLQPNDFGRVWFRINNFKKYLYIYKYKVYDEWINLFNSTLRDKWTTFGFYIPKELRKSNF